MNRKNTPLKMDDDVKEEFIRMKDYLESEGFKSISAYYVARGRGLKKNGPEGEDFNDFIINDFELTHLLFVAK